MWSEKFEFRGDTSPNIWSIFLFNQISSNFDTIGKISYVLCFVEKFATVYLCYWALVSLTQHYPCQCPLNILHFNNRFAECHEWTVYSSFVLHCCVSEYQRLMVAVLFVRYFLFHSLWVGSSTTPLRSAHYLPYSIEVERLLYKCVRISFCRSTKRTKYPLKKKKKKHPVNFFYNAFLKMYLSVTVA